MLQQEQVISLSSSDEEDISEPPPKKKKLLPPIIPQVAIKIEEATNDIDLSDTNDTINSLDGEKNDRVLPEKDKSDKISRLASRVESINDSIVIDDSDEEVEKENHCENVDVEPFPVGMDKTSASDIPGIPGPSECFKILTISEDLNKHVTTVTVQLCDCVVCFLLKKKFSTMNEKATIIKTGRPKPEMKNLLTKIKTCTRHFYADKSYEQYEWLTGCEIRNKLFCWPCLLFVDENGIWNYSGFSDLSNLGRVAKRHIISHTHLQAIIKEKVFGKTLGHPLDGQLQVNHQQHNELVDKNRDVLKRLIDVVCFLGQHELGFRGHDESIYSNYLDLVSLLSKYDSCLKAHFEQGSSFQGTSNRIQTDLISAISTVILNKIKEEIKQTRFVAIILEETTDVTKLSAVVLFINADGNPQERFLGFINVSEDRTADALYKIVCELIKSINARYKLVAQSYDGAAVMAGHLDGLQKKVRKTYPCAIFTHCFAHKSNLILSQSVMQFKECKVFFATLSGMAAFFSKSTQRTQAFDTVIGKRRYNNCCAAGRWNYNGKLVLTIREHRDSLIELFESILENSAEWDTETLNCSRGFLDSLKNNFNFNFLLGLFSEIFPFADNLFNLLQCKTNDIGFCVTKIFELKNIINKKRDDFDKCWKYLYSIGLEPQRKRLRTDNNIGDIKTCYRRLFYQILDQINQEIDTRFKNFEDLNFLELCNFNGSTGILFPETKLKCLMHHYGQFFDLVLLRSELIAIYDTKDIDKKKSASELLAFLRESELTKAYPEVVKLCELAMTILPTSASAEHSFFVHKRIKTYLQNSTGQDRFSSVSLLSIENNLVKRISQHPRFYNEVIDEFAKSDIKIQLHYK